MKIVPPRKGYAILIADRSYLATNGNPTSDVAESKVYYSKMKAEKALRIAKANHPNAELLEVSVGHDSSGAATVNGYPRKIVRSRTSIKRSIWSKYDGRCAYCGAQIALKECHMDAYYPLKGYVPENMMPACTACYVRKKGKTPKEFQEFLQSTLNSVRKDYRYKLVRRYGMILETSAGVTFYYMTPKAQEALREKQEKDKKGEGI